MVMKMPYEPRLEDDIALGLDEDDDDDDGYQELDRMWGDD